MAHPDKGNEGGKSKPNIQNVRFSIKGAEMTRNGKPCTFKDVQKGDTVVVTFSSKADSDKRTASKIEFLPAGSDAAAEEKPKGGEKKAK